MGTVYRKTATKPLPAGAKIIIRKGQRLAEWKPAKGKTRTAPVTVGKDGTDRIVVTAKTYTAKYRDGSGVVQEVATGCRDEDAARSRLAELVRQAECVKGKLLTADEARMIDHQDTPLAEHIAAYLTHQGSKHVSPGLPAQRPGNGSAAFLEMGTDFRFRLTAAEKQEVVTNCDHLARLPFSPTLPYAFTEHGAIMAASVLNTPRAIQASV